MNLLKALPANKFTSPFVRQLTRLTLDNVNEFFYYIYLIDLKTVVF